MDLGVSYDGMTVHRGRGGELNLWTELELYLVILQSSYTIQY